MIIPTLSWWEVVLRLVLAGVLAGSIGIERQLREREAGFRTHLLVGVGAALFTLTSAYGFTDFLASGEPVIRADPTRIAAQIVTGIGFLGAGAIIRQGTSIRGLTTAATLWLVAAIGLATGAGYYSAAVTTTAIALVSLWPLRIVAHRLLDRSRPSGLSIVLAPSLAPHEVLAVLEALGTPVRAFRVGAGSRGERVLTLSLEVHEDRQADVLARLSAIEGVDGVRWLT